MVIFTVGSTLFMVPKGQCDIFCRCDLVYNTNIYVNF